MNRLYTTLLLPIAAACLLCACGRPQPANCASLRKGSFHGQFRGQDGQLNPLFIIRVDSLQKERNGTDNSNSWYNVVWKDSCTYELHFVRTTRDVTEAELRFLQNAVVTTEIREVTPSYYTFTLSYNMSDMKMSDTLWIDP